ncbi:MAG TPA: phosphate ABC transporter permease subunit PstC [Alphaproteobacteria bacterium]|jgi:phosphate transport system permease protein|nr:phosphate ABC transporter permease subunit PstC [Alphaproteobacteria bacterium]
MTSAAVTATGKTGTRVHPKRIGNILFGGSAWTFGILVLILLAAVMIALVIGAFPAFQQFGISYIWTEAWNPGKDTYGALAPLYGTLISAFIAMIIGVPFSLGIAMFLTELCPTYLKRPISTAVELLAAVPSIIYGMWGLFVLAPLMQKYIEPGVISTFGAIPGVGLLFQGPPYGIGLLTAGVILSAMVLPYMVSIMRDVFETVPPQLRESAYGLGATTWEVVRSVVLPYSRVGVIGAFMLALGRALGETMAVTFVVGNSYHIKASILAPGTTISASLANEFAEADGLQLSALLANGFLLFVLTFSVIGFARVMLLRLQKKYG